MGPAAYPMQNTRRLSTGTGTTAGMAGFGVAAAHGGGAGGGPNTGFYRGPGSMGHEGTVPYGYPQPQPQPGEYYGPYSQEQPPLAAGVAAAGQRVPLPDDKYDDAYGGELDDYDDHPAAQQPHQPAHEPDMHRQDSIGTYHDEEHEMQPRTLKVRPHPSFFHLGVRVD
jgi:hypothetical protein